MTESTPPATSTTSPVTSTTSPADLSVSVNGERRSVAAGTTLDALVAGLTSAHSGVAAAVNEAVVPRGRWAATALAEGDRLEVLTAVQGG
ncbi:MULTISPECIES: sulfur carrier protein ThiS [unclassified Streptomyces]|uniref:sulfur carrier protein ThiS n=1 Tax=unclassified Streptomyces TaxID=2593676 RepID=UPI000804E92E|nr:MULTISPECIES: sulfur carrier protein ThiS [unclassified Streptomyces]MYR71433.1 sulfur carrier protein ThiS [Streptomyces sp. SID4925]SBV00771.1 sulfur carrier protein [Streptomyces sp. OspMP-M45]